MTQPNYVLDNARGNYQAILNTFTTYPSNPIVSKMLADALSRLNAAELAAQMPLTPSPFVEPVTPVAPATPLPAVVAGAETPVTLEQINRLIDTRLAQVQPQITTAMAKFDAVFKRALSAEDYAEFSAYVANGAKGFDDLLATDNMNATVQLLWETIKGYTK